MKKLIVLFIINFLILGAIMISMAQEVRDMSIMDTQEQAFFVSMISDVDTFKYGADTYCSSLPEYTYECTWRTEVDSSYKYAWPLKNEIRQANPYTVDAHLLSQGAAQENNIFTVSPYLPPIKTEHTYYRLPDEFRAELLWCLDNNSFKVPSLNNGVVINSYSFSEETNGYDNAGILGQWYILKGEDNLGVYYSYYDTYLPPKEVKGGELFFIYDRIYEHEMASLDSLWISKFNRCGDTLTEDCY